MKVVQMDVGVPVHIIAKNFPKQTVAQTVMVGVVLDLSLESVVILFVLEVVLDQQLRVYFIISYSANNF